MHGAGAWADSTPVLRCERPTLQCFLHSSEWISSSNSLLCCFLFFTPVLNKFHLIYFHSRGVFSPSSSNITCHFPRVPFLFFFLHLENAFQLFFSFTTPHQSVSHRPLKSFILIYIPVGFSLTHAYSCSCIIILVCIMIVDSSYFPISQFESWTFWSLAYHLFKHEGLNNAFIKKRKRLCCHWSVEVVRAERM